LVNPIFFENEITVRIGIWYFAVSVFVFGGLGLGELAGIAKNNNAKHLVSVILNLIKWQQEDRQGCAVFCRQKRPEYRNLHDLLVSLQVAHAATGV
jgi:hypothetical protein